MTIDRGADVRIGIDRVQSGAEDPRGVGAKTFEAIDQWSCLGSDQPDRPVTALNCRSSRPINCSAPSRSQI